MSSATIEPRGLSRLLDGSDFVAFVERRIGLTANGMIVVLLAVLGYILARFVTSRALLLLVYGVVLVILAAYAMGRRKLAVTATRSDLPSRVREGQPVEVELVLTARRGVSNMLLEENLPDSFGNRVVKPVPHLPAAQDVTHAYSFTPTLRGVYEVGPLTAVWSDPFGLTRHRLVLQEPTKVIVHPVTERVRDRVISREWEDPPIRPPVSRRWPTGFEFYGMRDYVSGDDPRRIVWRASAKTLSDDPTEGRYLVREAEQGITDQVFMVLDTDVEQHTSGLPSESFELAVRAAASLGSRHLMDGFSVNLEGNSKKLASGLRGRRQAIMLLDTLAAVTPEKEHNSVAIDRLLSGGRRNAHHILITPYISRQTASRLRLMLDRGTSMLLVLILNDDTDPLTLHRAGSLGCNVVELRCGQSMDRAFQHMAFLRGSVKSGR
jgi:uncharacterized protein (DUF58 family)